MGRSLAKATVNPEAARLGPQTLPKIDSQYIIPIDRVVGQCAGFVFEGATRLYFDHERPNDGHIEMIGPEFHLGIPLRTLSGDLDEKLIFQHWVPTEELRVEGEANPVAFSPFDIRITFNLEQALAFAATIQNASTAN